MSLNAEYENQRWKKTYQIWVDILLKTAINILKYIENAR